MSAIEQAYASNASTPLVVFEFLHSAFTGGAIRLAQSYYDIEATLEDLSTQTFSKSGIGFAYPEKSTEGRQDLNIQIDNVSREVWQEIKKVITANRTTTEKVICKMRTYLPSDLTAPAGAIYMFTVTKTSVMRDTATFRASYTPIPNVSYPRKRYYTTDYPGLKYV
mgnify:CR=1 FL=1